ncbi:MAG: hypothetical protein WCI29_00925 [Actinomycetes bacterium]
MSSLLNPVGPAGRTAYWIRRLVLLGLVLVLVLGLKWLIFGRGTQSADTNSPGGSSTSAPSTNPSVSPTNTADAGQTLACADSDLKVTASTDAARYPVGSTPRLRMKIENVSAKPCTRDIGAAQNELVIRSGSVRVWSSDDCSPGGSPDIATLAPGQSFSVTVTWPGRLSAPGCTGKKAIAKAGTYRLVGRNGTLRSSASPFSLT